VFYKFNYLQFKFTSISTSSSSSSYMNWLKPVGSRVVNWWLWTECVTECQPDSVCINLYELTESHLACLQNNQSISQSIIYLYHTKAYEKKVNYVLSKTVSVCPILLP